MKTCGSHQNIFMVVLLPIKDHVYSYEILWHYRRRDNLNIMYDMVRHVTQSQDKAIIWTFCP